MAARDGDAVGRDGARLAAIAYGERLGQDRRNLWRERRARMIDLQGSTATQEMVKTGLPRRGRELPIGGPAVTDQRAIKIRAQDRSGFFKASTCLNRVHRRGGRRIRPEPLQPAAHFPAGLIGHDDGTLPDRLDQRPVGGRRLSCRTVQGMDQTAGSNRQSDLLLIHAGDFAERHPILCVQDGGGGRGARADLRRGSAQGIRRPQRVAPLHPAPTPLTAPMWTWNWRTTGRTTGSSS